MFTSFRSSLRALLLALALAVAVLDTGGRGASARTQPTPHTTARTEPTSTDAPVPPRNDDPFEGALIVAGIVVLVVALAWVCSRIGDSHSAQ